MKKVVNPPVSPFKRFFEAESLGSLLLIGATLIALVLANSILATWLERILDYPLCLETRGKILTIRDWINDGVMSVFFLAVALEIKREIRAGELSSRSRASLPVIAAIGGMLVPASIFLVFNFGAHSAKGWGIPVATDIAFSLGILALLGNRIPVGVRIFVAALAIADDIGAIVIIAIFYANDIRILYAFLAGLLSLAILAIRRIPRLRFEVILLGGVFLWYVLLQSGIHPTISGVILAFILPESDSVSAFEVRIQKIASFLIMPLFALANAGIFFDSHSVYNLCSSRLSIGVFLGLVIGKPVGIYLFAFLSLKFKIASLPRGINWSQLFGASALCGIGFTISIFISRLAFGNEPELYNEVNFAILIASGCAAIIGITLLWVRSRSSVETNPVLRN